MAEDANTPNPEQAAPEAENSETPETEQKSFFSKLFDKIKAAIMGSKKDPKKQLQDLIKQLEELSTQFEGDNQQDNAALMNNVVKQLQGLSGNFATAQASSNQQSIAQSTSSLDKFLDQLLETISNLEQQNMPHSQTMGHPASSSVAIAGSGAAVASASTSVEQTHSSFSRMSPPSSTGSEPLSQHLDQIQNEPQEKSEPYTVNIAAEKGELELVMNSYDNKYTGINGEYTQDHSAPTEPTLYFDGEATDLTFSSEKEAVDFLKDQASNGFDFEVRSRQDDNTYNMMMAATYDDKLCHLGDAKTPFNENDEGFADPFAASPQPK